VTCTLSLPFSNAQADLLAANDYWPGLSMSHRFIMSSAVEVSGELDYIRLDQAFRQLIGRNQNLRCRISETAFGGWVQELLDTPSCEPGLQIGSSEIQTVADAVRELSGLAIDPKSGSPARCYAFCLGEKRFLVALAFHHLFVDGEGLKMLERELWDLYGGLVAPSLQGKNWTDFCLDTAERAANPGNRDRSLAYWSDFYGRYPASTVEADRSPVAASSNSLGFQLVRLDPSEFANVAAALAATRVLPSSLFAGAALETLQAMNSERGARLYDLRAARFGPAGRASSGPAFSLFPIGLDERSGDSVGARLADLTAQTLRAQRYCTLPLHQRWEELDYVDMEYVGAGPRALVFFQTNVKSDDLSGRDDLTLRKIDEFDLSAGAWMSPGVELLATWAQGEYVSFACRYDVSRFSAGTISALLEATVESLGRFVAVLNSSG
jgi:Condensation domain